MRAVAALAAIQSRLVGFMFFLAAEPGQELGDDALSLSLRAAQLLVNTPSPAKECEQKIITIVTGRKIPLEPTLLAVENSNLAPTAR
jgi:hypothetical protein